MRSSRRALLASLAAGLAVTALKFYPLEAELLEDEEYGIIEVERIGPGGGKGGCGGEVVTYRYYRVGPNGTVDWLSSASHA